MMIIQELGLVVGSGENDPVHGKNPEKFAQLIDGSVDKPV